MNYKIRDTASKRYKQGEQFFTVGPRSRHITINIPSPPKYNEHQQFLQNQMAYSLHASLEKQLHEVKDRIQISNKVLFQSRRQSKSPNKIVSADAIAITYNYRKKEKKGINFSSEKEGKKYQDSISQEQNQGLVHILTSIFAKQSSKQKLSTDRCRHKNVKDEFKLQNFYSKEYKPSANLTTSLLTKQSYTPEKIVNTADKSDTLGLSKKYFLKQQNMNRSKEQLLHKTRDSIKTKQADLRQYLTRSQQYLKKNILQNQNLTKGKYKTQFEQKDRHISIKLNKLSGQNIKCVRPRYQIQFSKIDDPSATIVQKQWPQIGHQRWKELKVKEISIRR